MLASDLIFVYGYIFSCTLEDLWLLTFPVFFFFFTDGIYRIVYEEVDESDVKIFCFPSSNANFGEVEEFR
jgi:hypothetical protein